MEFPSPADGTMNVSQSSSSSESTDRMYPSLEAILNANNSLNSDDEFESNDSKSPPPTLNRRHLFPEKEFVDKLRPEEVRWFYKQEGDKKWTPFIGYDSLRIECRYRALAYGDEVGNDIDMTERILVRGGLYEVDVATKKCHPIYWKDDEADIVQGIWFYDNTWQPLEEGYAMQIETEHMATFLGKRLVEAPPSPAKGGKPVMHQVRFQEFHVSWFSPVEIFLYSESASSKFMRSVSKTLGWQASGTKLHRGYCSEAVMDDKPPDITHLVFVIHGIGQKMDSKHIVRCCRDLREKVSLLKNKYFPEFQSVNRRAEFLPVEWRSSLKLDGDVVESVTPSKMRGVRTILNSSAMDILYYTSPLYRSEITHSLQSEMHHQYTLFCSRHPYFEANGGKVSIIAHSLGSVIFYDIITGWNPIKQYDQLVTSVIDEEAETASGSEELLAELSNARKRVAELETLLEGVKERQHKASPPLPFRIENFFCLGSPLAVFLALRGVRPQGIGTQDHILPSQICSRLFNIYHPSDPVAYRLEPLILKHYATIMPLPIHHHDIAKKTPYIKMERKAYPAMKTIGEEMKGPKEMKGSTEDVTSSSEDQPTTTRAEDPGTPKSQKFSLSKWLTDLRASKQPVDDKLAPSELKLLQNMEKEAQKIQESTTVYIDPKDIDKTELEYRLDYQLRERSLENSYMSLLTSHTSYWTRGDVCFFILSHLHPELQDT